MSSRECLSRASAGIGADASRAARPDRGRPRCDPAGIHLEGDEFAAQGCINGVQPSLAGARMPNSPKFKGNVTLDKRFNTPGLPFDPDLGLAYRYQTQVNFDVLQNPFARMGGFGITNLRVGIRSHDDTWNVHAYVNNLFDKRYYGFAGQSAIWTVAPVISAQIPRDASRYFGVSIGGRF